MTEREQFEAWVTNKGHALHPENNGRYGNETVRNWWEGWQARAQPAITSETGNTPAQGASAITSESAQAVPPDVVRDAERYRWLRDNCVNDVEPEGMVVTHRALDFGWLSPTWEAGKRKPPVPLDAAIDAAIAAQGAKT